MWGNVIDYEFYVLLQLSADGSKLQGMVILLTQLEDLVVFYY
jgi:hypothetical protein